LFEGVEEVVEVEDTEFVAGRDERDEGTGLAGFGVADEEEFDEVIRLMLA